MTLLLRDLAWCTADAAQKGAIDNDRLSPRSGGATVAELTGEAQPEEGSASSGPIQATRVIPRPDRSPRYRTDREDAIKPFDVSTKEGPRARQLDRGLRVCQRDLGLRV